MGNPIKHTLDLEPDWKDVMEIYIRWISGETTLGSKDDDYRNAITQFSYYHFVTCAKHYIKVT